MSRPPQLSPDNILRFLQLRGEPASTKDISQALALKKADTQPLYKMLAKLKVYAGPDHPHAAQQPIPLELPAARRAS